jgi:hypothetical protein
MNTDYTHYYNDSSSTLFEDIYYQGISEYDWHIVQLQLQKEEKELEEYCKWRTDQIQTYIYLEKNLENQIKQELDRKTPPIKKRKIRQTSRSTFTQKEDQTIIKHVDKYGTNNWASCALKLPNRNGKQCRERYTQQLDPNISKEPWSEFEDNLLLDLTKRFGKRWTLIAQFLPGRTCNNVKNRYNSKYCKKS